MGISTELHRGSDCNGVSGAANRVLTLSNTSQTDTGGFMVYVNGLALVPTVDFTVVHASVGTQITFLNAVFDYDYMVINYVLVGATIGNGKYCSYTDVYNKTGLSTSEVGSAIVNALILDAEAELEMLTGRLYSNANSATDFISIKGADLIGNYQTSVQLTHYPVQSITSCSLLDIDGNATATFAALSSVNVVAKVFETDDYWLEVGNDPLNNAIVPGGRLVLKTNTISKGTNIVKVVYTYGYAVVPQSISNLAVCLTGIRVWLAFMGASYNRLNSYSIPQQAANKGDFYDRCQQNISLLTAEADRLLDRVGRKSRTLFFATGSAR